MPRRRLRRWIIGASVLAGTGGIVAIASIMINPRITSYVESSAFRAEMEKETAKGLHFEEARFGPIKRTAFLQAETTNFRAKEGRKAMTGLRAEGISARFNRLGVFLRRWQVDDLRIDRGVVGIQVYEPKPEASPAKPWYHIFLPDRVYLKAVHSDAVDVTWRLLGGNGGIFSTRILITPHGRDFEYRATGGTMKNALTPDLPVRHVHMLITRKLFQLYQLDLTSGAGGIHGEGSVEMQGDKRVDFNLRWDKLPVSEWIPNEWNGHITGAASGALKWTGSEPKLNTTEMRGNLRVSGARISKLKLLDELAAVSRRADLKELELEECAAEVIWDKGRGELKNIAIEDEDKFRIQGNVVFSERSLGGVIQLGVARDYLTWMPHPEEVFPRVERNYLYTTVHLSGTLDNPQQDLSPRLLEALKESPWAYLGAALRALAARLRSE